MTASFIHLHVHSEYSLSDSIVRIPALIEKAVASGMPAVAVTDSANVFGLVKFYKAAMEAGLKPLVGVDAWVHNQANANAPYRLVLLAKNAAGYRGLCELLSRAYLENQLHGRACLQLPWLEESAHNLIALSGAQEGELGQSLLSSTPERANQVVEQYLELFGDAFYIELQRVGRRYEEEYIDVALALAAERSIPVVATNCVEFLTGSDFENHEVRVCIHDGRVLNDRRRPRHFTEQQYFRSQSEMEELWRDLPEALENTVEIAKRCNFMLEIGDYYLPNFPVPEHKTPEQHLRDEAERGLQERLQALGATEVQEYHERLDLELEVISHMGFPGYFLIVADFIHWAKENGIPVGPGRGSGAGSLVAWVLGITELDPIAHGLLFERFLNPERVSLPDFDIDFCMEGRDRVIEYVAQHYGREKVSQIITYGTMAARAVVRDVGRVLGMPYGYVDKIAKLIPFEIGMTLDTALKQEPLLQEEYEKEDIRELLDRARALEGLVRNVGKHAGGVVIAPTPLTDFTALYAEQSGEHIVTQFDKDDLESIGLVKFDFLGLRTLTIIDRALKTINTLREQTGEPPVVLARLPMDDARAFELLQKCRTTALFQLESRGMKDIIQRLQPDHFDDLVALVALYRPGPLQSGMVEDFIDRKHGRAAIAFPHPDLEPILRPTYGVILYQEQVMEIAQVLAGYSLGSADLLRRAMGKKKPEEMARQREIFVGGAKKNKVEEKTAAYIFDLMEKFAGYGFNKSHSAAYALITYQTAWLKAHYPAQFMAAALSADMEHTDKVVTLIAECREMGLEVVSPSVNICNYAFEADADDRIRYGLGAIKGIGFNVIEAIVEARDSSGIFQDLFDLCDRIDIKKVNRRALESLIQAGALDDLGPHRAALMATLPKALSVAGQQSQDRSAGQSDMFGIAAPGEDSSVHAYEEADEWEEERLLAAEKETLGLYLSGHPINAHRAELDQFVDARLADLNPANDRTVIVAGLVVGLRTMNTRRGGRMAFVTLDDRSGRLELAVFSELFNSHRELLKKDNILVVKGQVSVDEFTGGFKMAADAVYDIEQARNLFAAKLLIQLDAQRIEDGTLDAVAGLLREARNGPVPIWIQYCSGDAQGTLRVGEDWKIDISNDFLRKLESVVGENGYRVIYKENNAVPRMDTAA